MPTVLPEGTLLDTIITKGRMARDDSQMPYAKDLIGELVTQILDEGMTVSADTGAMLTGRIAQIDQLITDQLNEIMHQPEFQKLEASWRGLSFLVMNTETGPMLKLRLLNITQKELLSDLEKAVEFDQSQMFKKVYEEEYGTFGGYPYTMLVGDYEFGRHPQDMALLEMLSNVAAAAHAPFIAMASPRLFDMDSFTELGTPRDLSKIFESLELIKWRSFRDSEDSRYVSLTMPHILMRLPLWCGNRARGRAQFRGRNRRKRPFQVSLGKFGLCPGPAHHQRLCLVQMVRGHPGRGGRRPGGGASHPHL